MDSVRQRIITQDMERSQQGLVSASVYPTQLYHEEPLEEVEDERNRCYDGPLEVDESEEEDTFAGINDLFSHDYVRDPNAERPFDDHAKQQETAALSLKQKFTPKGLYGKDEMAIVSRERKAFLPKRGSDSESSIGPLRLKKGRFGGNGKIGDHREKVGEFQRKDGFNLKTSSAVDDGLPYKGNDRNCHGRTPQNGLGYRTTLEYCAISDSTF